MMVNRKFLEICFLAIFCPSFIFASERKVMDVSAYGILPDKTDATPLLRNLLDSLRTEGVAAEIHFPKGEYHFYPEKAVGKYHCITNHSNKYRYFAFPLTGFNDIGVDGNGSEFIFHGEITPFLVENSSGVTLKNFNVDWEVPFYIQADVVKVDSLQRTVEIEIDKKFSNFYFDAGRLRIRGEKWRFEYLGENILFDPQTKAVAWHAEEATLRDEPAVEKLGERCFRIHWKGTSRLPVTGQIATFRGAMPENRIAPAVHLTHSSGILLNNINIYHCGGMGVIAEKSRDIHLDAFNVVLREGSGRIASSHADATHFCNCAGNLLVENCIFENMFDDAINVHGTYMQITEIVNPRTVIARLSHFQQTNYQFASANDSIRFIHRNTLLPQGGGAMDKTEVINERLYKLTFKNDLPQGVEVGSGLENISWYPESFVFRNNIVRNNRARAILVSSGNKCVIENNTISTMKSAVLLEGDLDHWFESGAVRDLVIRNNTFGNTSYGGGDYPTVFIHPHVKKHEKGKYYETNIRIENNTFNSYNSNLISADAVDGLTITGNRFTETTNYSDDAQWDSPFRITRSDNVIIGKNLWKRSFPVSVEVDEEMKQHIRSDIPVTNKKVDIVLAPAATVGEQNAAAQLGNYLREIYPSYDFNITSTGNKSHIQVKIELGKISVQEEGFIIQQRAKDEVVIASQSEKGLFNAVYSLLEKLGYGFYLSYEVQPDKRTELQLKGWEMQDTPLQKERIVFDWHNFLSGCTGWNYADWCAWIDQSAKMKYNTIMVHAYGNNPVFGFEYNGLKKNIGYLTTSQSGRDWGAQHINDVRRLPGGEIFDSPVFGSQAAMVPDQQRGEAAVQLMSDVFKHAREMAMKINFAVDADTWSANPKNIIESLPANCRIKLKDQDIVNPETPDGYQYYKAQVKSLLDHYPQISTITVWVRNDWTLWLSIKPEQFPATWQEAWQQFLSDNPEMSNDKFAASTFAFSKIVKAFQQAVSELNRKDVNIAFGSWNWFFLPSASIVMPENCTLIPLDYSINFESDKTKDILSKIGEKRQLIPIVWAQHDDHRYMGKPYTPYSGFNRLLNERKAAGFGIIHWMTRPLDLIFKSLSEQVWSDSENESLDQTLTKYGQKVFGSGQPVIKEYLKEWLTKGPMFGRETFAHFFDLGKQPDGFEPYSVSIEKAKGRIALLNQIKTSDLSESGNKMYQYCAGMENFYVGVLDNQEKFTQAYLMLERQQTDSAKAIIGQCNPEAAVELYARVSNLLPITSGEKAMVVSMGTRWLPDFLDLKQRVGLANINYKFSETLHDSLAQHPGAGTYFIDNKNVWWSCMGVKELKNGKAGQVTAAEAKQLPDYAQQYMEISQPLAFPLTTIGKNKLAPGRYNIEISYLGNNNCELFLLHQDNRTPLPIVCKSKTKPAVLSTVIEITADEIYFLEIVPQKGNVRLTNLSITN